MKTSLLITPKFITFISFLACFISCTSHTEEGENAFESLRESRLMTGDSATVTEVVEIIEVPVQTHRKDKKKILNEWAQFNIDMEKNLDLNEKRIAEIKAIPHISIDAFDKVTTLENENHEMRLELYDYIEINPERHEKFKIKFALKINSIKAELDELKIKSHYDALMLLD